MSEKKDRKPRVKATLYLRDFGNPKDVVEAKEDRISLGKLIGVVSSVKELANPIGGDPLRGVKGVVEFYPANGGEKLAVKNLFMPPQVLKGVFDLLDADATSVEFAFDIGSKKSKNKAGYDYAINVIVPASEVDALATLRTNAGVK